MLQTSNKQLKLWPPASQNNFINNDRYNFMYYGWSITAKESPCPYVRRVSNNKLLIKREAERKKETRSSMGRKRLCSLRT
jgi:hypothetical protein